MSMTVGSCVGAVSPESVSETASGKDQVQGEAAVSVLKKAMEVDADMVKTLIACGTDVNAVNARGDTPLFQAILHDDFRWVKLLIDHRAKVNTKDKMGLTPLSMSREDPEVFMILKKAGAKE